MQKIIGKILKANNDFKMFEEKDKIAVGVSGGKDSLILLEAMGRIVKFLYLKINVIAITIDLGFGENVEQYDQIKEICEKHKIEPSQSTVFLYYCRKVRLRFRSGIPYNSSYRK